MNDYSYQALPVVFAIYAKPKDRPEYPVVAGWVRRQGNTFLALNTAREPIGSYGLLGSAKGAVYREFERQMRGGKK